MKQKAIVLIAVIVLGALFSGHSIAAQQDPDLEAESAATAETVRTATAAGDSTDDEQTRTVTGAEEHSDQWTREMGVLVMSHADLDTTKIVKGWHAHVVYASEGVRGTASGEIVDKDADGFVVRSGPWARPEIAYAVIETLAVAPDRRTLEKWRKVREAADYVNVMYRDDLDPAQIAVGWYAHVVYMTDGKESAVTGEIADMDSAAVTIETAPPVRRRGLARRRSLQIAFEDIDVIVVSERRDAVEAWPKNGLAAGPETRKRPWCEIGANLLSVSILKGQSDDTVTLVNGGGGMARLTPTFYMSSFFTERISFDFGMAFTYQATTGSRNTTLRVAQGGFGMYTRGLASGSSYCRILATTLDGDLTDSRFGAGIGLGTRHVFRNAVVLRYEVQYVRWLGEEYEQANQIELLLNVGVVLGGR